MNRGEEEPRPFPIDVIFNPDHWNINFVLSFRNFDHRAARTATLLDSGEMKNFTLPGWHGPIPWPQPWLHNWTHHENQGPYFEGAKNHTDKQLFGHNDWLQRIPGFHVCDTHLPELSILIHDPTILVIDPDHPT